MAKPLTAAAVRSIRPTGARQEIRDGACAGLYVVVQPSGHKSFAMRFRRPGGRAAKLVLGPFYPARESAGDPVIGAPLTLAAARALASSLSRERARGRDIIADRQARAEVAADDFPRSVREYIERHARPQRRGWKDTARALGLTPEGDTIRGGLCDLWAERPVTAIDSQTIYAAVEEARRSGIPGSQARNKEALNSRGLVLFSALSSLFTWLVQHRRVEKTRARASTVRRRRPRASAF